MPTLASSSPAAPNLVRDQRRTLRSAGVGLGLLTLASLISPLLAWQEEIALAREELTNRLWDQARVEAGALALHLRILEAELSRIANHEELSPEDGVSDEEVSLLALALGKSALFSDGVALLSIDGVRLWSDPARLSFGDTPLSERGWFHRVRREQRPLVDLLDATGEGRLVVVVPVLRDGKAVAFLLGAVSASTGPLPGAQGLGADAVLLVDENGRKLLSSAPDARIAPLLPSLSLAELQSRALLPGPLEVEGRRLLVATAPLEGSGLILSVIEDEAQATNGLWKRFVGQLVFHSALLLGTLAFFTFLLRRTYRALLEAEDRLRHQETMAALGLASQLIAHEVKNALNGIQAALSALRPMAGTHDLPIQALRAQVGRLANLARSLLSFGSPRVANRRSCELSLLVEEALQAVALIPESSAVRLETELAGGLRVHADPALLVSSVDNLVRNAVEAGAVARDTGLRADPWVRVTLVRSDGEALLTVEDDAGGVDPTLEPRLWEPFATARAKGIGLGLPMARKAVEEHGGSLLFVRTPLGSRFVLRLPLETSSETAS